jgi:type IV pilus assembly protein PilC
MPVFDYSALTTSGTEVAGDYVASSSQEVRAELAARGLIAQKIRRRRAPLLVRAHVRPEEFLLFNQEFTALARAGLTIPDALGLAAQRPENPRFGKILTKVLGDVQGGALFSAACRRHPEVFDELYVSALSTGEKTGDLAAALARYQDYLRRRVVLGKKLAQALAYPAFLLIALAVILAVLFAFVLPRFAAMYADFGAQLPLPTRLLIAVVDHLPWLVPAAIAAATTLVYGYRRMIASPRGRLWLAQAQERLPYVGELRAIVGAAQLARSLATLLAGGTPLVEAMRTASAALSNRAHALRLERAAQRVAEGGRLAAAMRDERLMPETGVRMVAVGEASGGLDAMLAEVAQFYEERLDARLARITALIEPLLMLLVGVLVGGIIVVMYLPIFGMADVIK